MGEGEEGGIQGFPRNWGRWLTAVILSTWETEIKGIVVGSQTRQIVLKNPSHPIPGHLGMPIIPGYVGSSD
jgi:hypothetical protein